MKRKARKIGEWDVRWLLVLGVAVAIAVVALFFLPLPQSIIVLHNMDHSAIVACTMRIEADFEFNRTVAVGAIASGASVVRQTGRLNEASITLDGRYTDGRVIETTGGPSWDPSPGDTIWLEIRGYDYSVRWTNGVWDSLGRPVR